MKGKDEEEQMGGDPPAISYFKQCPSCEQIWDTLEEFLSDPELELAGFQANIGRKDEGVLLFNHKCGTTLGVSAGMFRPLYHGPIYTRPAEELVATCPGFCQHSWDLSPCDEECDCAYARDIIQAVQRWPKTESPSPPGL